VIALQGIKIVRRKFNPTNCPSIPLSFPEAIASGFWPLVATYVLVSILL
jgi:hypothetical protein